MGCTLLGKKLSSSKIHKKMNFYDKNDNFAVNLIGIATITYFFRFESLVFVSV